MALIEFGSLEADRVENARHAASVPACLLEGSQDGGADALASKSLGEVKQIEEQQTQR